MAVFIPTYSLRADVAADVIGREAENVLHIAPPEPLVGLQHQRNDTDDHGAEPDVPPILDV